MISETDIKTIIRQEELQLKTPHKKLWHKVRRTPEKWACANGGEFWIVGTSNQNVIWYNHIEEGFNISNFQKTGKIEDYWCNQDELTHIMHKLSDQLAREKNAL